MAKSSNRGLWIGISILAIGTASYLIYKKFFKSKDQKECEAQGGTWNTETKSCDLPVTEQTTNSSKDTNVAPNSTGKANLDLIIDRLTKSGKKANVSKTKDGKLYIELVSPIVPIGKDNKIQFYENDIFWYGSKKGQMISKGIYADGGRKLSVNEGRYKSLGIITNSLNDSLKKLVG